MALAQKISANSLDKFGGAYRIDYLPDGLQIMQQGKVASHFEIIPTTQMPLEQFQNLLNQIRWSGPY